MFGVVYSLYLVIYVHEGFATSKFGIGLQSTFSGYFLVSLQVYDNHLGSVLFWYLHFKYGEYLCFSLSCFEFLDHF